MKVFRLTLTRTYQTYIDVEAKDKEEAQAHLTYCLDNGDFYTQELEESNVIEEQTKIEEVKNPLVHELYQQVARSFMDFLNAKYELEIMCSLDEYCSLCPPNLLTKEETDLIDAFVNTRYNLN